MHGSSLCRMAWFVEKWLLPDTGLRNVLDVGSCEVAGGSYRHLFAPERFTYTGLDLAPGRNVDIIPALPYHWPEIADNAFDVVISGQAFEHMEFFWLAAVEMSRCLRPGGLLCLIAPRGFDRHRYPVDCFRFDADGMLAIARWCNLMPLHVSTDLAPPGSTPAWHIENCEDSLLVARKPANWSGPARPQEYQFTPADMAALAQDFRELPKQAASAPVPPAAPAPTPNDAYEAVIQSLAQEVEHLRNRVALYENSNSWRLTAPLRRAGKLVRALLPGLKKAQ